MSEQKEMITRFPAIVVPALKKWDSTVIFIHGLGDSGAGWSFLSENWHKRSSAGFSNTAFIFPHAPQIPVTGNMGMRMPGWYDIINFQGLGDGAEDEEGMRKSMASIEGIIKEQLSAGVPSKRIILGGFSQGGVMALLTGLTCPDLPPLGGIVGLSSYLPMRAKFAAAITENNKNTPIFMGHGKEDPLVRHEWGTKSRDFLKEEGCQVEWHDYDGLGHSADFSEIADLEKWIIGRLEENKNETGTTAAAASSNM